MFWTRSAVHAISAADYGVTLHGEIRAIHWPTTTRATVPGRHLFAIAPLPALTASVSPDKN